MNKKNITTKNILLFLQKNYAVILIAILPLLLFIVNRNIFVINPFIGRIDPFVYTGFFLNFESLFHMFGVTYYGARLSWVIPGYVLYHSLAPIIANYVLHFAFYYAALFSCYYILKNTLTERVALFCTILTGTYVYLLIEMGRDYVAFPVITFFLLTLVFLMFSTGMGSRKFFLFPAGICFVLMVYANLFAVVFTPTVIAFYLVALNVRAKKITFKNIFLLLSGGLLAAFLMEIFSYLHSGNFLVVLKQVEIGNYYLNRSNPWYLPMDQWIFTAGVMYLLPILVIIGCIFYLYIRKINATKKWNNFTQFFVINYLWISSMLIGLQIMGNPVLQFSYYSCYLILPMFFAIGVICSDILDVIPKKQFYLLIVLEICILVLPYSPDDILFKRLSINNGLLVIFLIFSICWICFFLLSQSIQKIKNSKVIIPIIIIACILMSFLNGAYFVTSNSVNGAVFSPNLQIIYPENYDTGFVSIVESAQEINTMTNGQPVRFWYNANELGENGFYGGLFNNINSMYLWQYSYVNRDFPNITKSDIKKTTVVNHSIPLVVILSSKSEAFDQARLNLQKTGYDASLVSVKNIDEGKIHFYIIIIQIHPVSGQENISSDVSQYTSAMLENVIASEYPEINNQNITDWEKVNILRDWAYEHTDYPNVSIQTSGKILNAIPESHFYQKEAPEIYSIYLNDQGAVVCSGSAYSLERLYEMYGYKSYFVNLGDPIVANQTSHAITLVQINHNGKPLLSVEDAYFDYTIVDKEKNPIDFFEIVKLLRNERFSDIEVQYGTKKPCDVINNKSEANAFIQNSKIVANPLSDYNWTVLQNNSTVELPDGLVKMKIQKDLEKYDNSMRDYHKNSIIKSPYYNETFPALSLYKYPFSITRNANPDNTLLKKMECITNNNCSTEDIPDLTNKQFNSIILRVNNQNSFLNEFQPNCYAGKCYEISENGSIFFLPKSDSDHIASKFFIFSNISSNDNDIITKIVYTPDNRTMSDLRITIQNRDYQTISDNLNEYIISNATEKSGSYFNQFSLSKKDTAFRILIQGQSNKAYLLPEEIILYQITG